MATYGSTTTGNQHARMIYPAPNTGRVSPTYWQGTDATTGEEISKKPSLRQVQQLLAMVVIVAIGALGLAVMFIGIGTHSWWFFPGIAIIAAAVGLGRFFNKLLPDRK
jgi:fatty acid desaturase